MTIQDLGSLGELVGAVATVATLLYLAVQIRHNTRTVRAANASDALGQQNELALLLGQNPEVAKLYFEGLAGAELDETESRQFQMLIGVWINHSMQSLILEEEGLLSPQLRTNFRASAEWVVAQPGFDLYWSAWSHTASPQIAELIESIRKRQAEAAAQQRDEVGR